MAENDEASGAPADDVTTPGDERPVLPPDTAAAPTVPGAQPVLKTRWRDRAWSFRALLAVALATLVIGGVVGGTIVAVADDDHGDDGYYRMGPGGKMPPGWRNPHRFQDGGPQWRWNDGPRPPDGDLTPYGQSTPSPATPSPATPSPTQ